MCKYLESLHLYIFVFKGVFQCVNDDSEVHVQSYNENLVKDIAMDFCYRFGNKIITSDTDIDPCVVL